MLYSFVHVRLFVESHFEQNVQFASSNLGMSLCYIKSALIWAHSWYEWWFFFFFCVNFRFFSLFPGLFIPWHHRGHMRNQTIGFQNISWWRFTILRKILVSHLLLSQTRFFIICFVESSVKKWLLNTLLIEFKYGTL